MFKKIKKILESETNFICNKSKKNPSSFEVY